LTKRLRSLRSHVEGSRPEQSGPTLEPLTTWDLSLARLRKMFHRSSHPALLLRQPVAPSIVLACEQCGFDYSVTKIELAGGKEAAIWSCECGSRYIPPGGVELSQYVCP